MQFGISTASLFGRLKTLDALKLLNENNIDVAEVFLESFCEYNKKFGKALKKVKGNTDIHSVHVLTTQYEPQLFSVNEVAREDSFKFLEGAMDCAKACGAKYYTFHGTARYKITGINMDFDLIGKNTQRIIDVCSKRGITLAFENVHWCYYNYIGFFNELRKRTEGLKGTLDIKQARQSNLSVKDLIKEMNSDIVTVHLSDIDKEGKMCLPGKGVTDFKELFKMLSDVGFNGAMLLEVYKNDYKDYNELFNSLEFIKETAKSVFNN